MKIRAGFVSNSSSTSFVMYGINIPEGELFPDDDDGYSIAEKLELSLHHAGEEGWGYYIGKDLHLPKLGEIDVNGCGIGEGFNKDVEAKVKEFLRVVGYEGPYKFGIYAKTYAS
jgi:hypothetical protein